MMSQLSIVQYLRNAYSQQWYIAFSLWHLLFFNYRIKPLFFKIRISSMKDSQHSLYRWNRVRSITCGSPYSITALLQMSWVWKCHIAFQNSVPLTAPLLLQSIPLINIMLYICSGKMLHVSVGQNSRHAGWVSTEEDSQLVQVFQIVALSALSNTQPTKDVKHMGLGSWNSHVCF